jgi:nitrogenase-associated protein
MAHVIFYEKPGCGGNARQKALLLASGHRVEARSMLTERWSVSTLRPYFGEKPVKDWFNPASPRVKSGEIEPDTIAPHMALDMMIADPTLIRRPLMRVEDRCVSGFDQELVGAWIGLTPANAKVTDTCIRSTAKAANEQLSD